MLDGAYIPHTPIPHTDSVIHNDAGNVSHDIYAVSLDSVSPGGNWWIPDYPACLDPEYFMEIFYLQNVPDEFELLTQPWVPGYPIYTVVEYAIQVRPLDYRGDCNGDEKVDVADVVHLINYLFHGTSAPDPLYKADANCDEKVNVVDVVRLINYLFSETSVPTCCGP